MEGMLSSSIREVSISESEKVRAVINASNRQAYRGIIPAEYFREEALSAAAMRPE